MSHVSHLLSIEFHLQQVTGVPFQDRFESLDSVRRLPATGQFVTFAGEAEHLRLDTVVLKQSEQLLALLDGTPPICLGVQNNRGGRDPVGVTERRSCPEFVPGRPCRTYMPSKNVPMSEVPTNAVRVEPRIGRCAVIAEMVGTHESGLSMGSP
jgi:hypothetical protein